MALVAWYPLNGNLIDNGLYGNDLINHGTIINKSGKIGKCYEVTSNDTYMESNKEFPAMNQVSLSAWVCMSDTVDTLDRGLIPVISLFNNNKNGAVFGIRRRNDVWRADVTYYNGTEVVTNENNNDKAIQYNIWTHILTTIDFEKNTFKIYVNGNFVGEKNNTDKMTPMINTKLYINQYSNSYNAREFKGKINDVRVYDCLLSQSEVKEIYRSLILKYSFDTPVVDPKISMARTTNISNLLDGGTNRCAIIGDVIYNREYFVDNNYVTISFDLNIKDIAPLETNKGHLSIQGRTVIDGTEKWGTFVSVANELYGRSMQLRIYRRNNKLHKFIRKWTISYRKML